GFCGGAVGAAEVDAGGGALEVGFVARMDGGVARGAARFAVADDRLPAFVGLVRGVWRGIGRVAPWGGAEDAADELVDAGEDVADQAADVGEHLAHVLRGGGALGLLARFAPLVAPGMAPLVARAAVIARDVARQLARVVGDALGEARRVARHAPAEL